MTSGDDNNVQSFQDAPGVENTMGNCSSANAVPSEPLGQNTSHAPANGMQTNDHGLPLVTQKSVIDPVSLLPKDGTVSFLT